MGRYIDLVEETNTSERDRIPLEVYEPLIEDLLESLEDSDHLIGEGVNAGTIARGKLLLILKKVKDLSKTNTSNFGEKQRYEHLLKIMTELGRLVAIGAVSGGKNKGLLKKVITFIS